MSNPAVYCFRWLARQLARRDVIDDARGRRIADLAWPRFVTMLARFSLRVADISMIGLSLGYTAVAGITFAVVYWQFAFAFGLGLAGGTIAMVAQHYSSGRSDTVDLVIKQSAVLGVVLCLPFVVAYVLVPTELVGAFTSDPEAIRYGGTYLQVSAVALVFVTFNVVAGRALAGADDTWIPMAVRATGAVVNIGLNAVFIFGLQLGVAGAALGSVVAEGLVAACFAAGFVRGRLPGVGSFPVRISPSRPVFDGRLVRQLAGITPPLVVQRLGMVVVRFPLFALLAAVGPVVVSAFEVARRVRNLLNAFGAGFSMSVSSLVGQELGQGNEAGAKAVGRDTVAFSTIVYLLASVVVFLLAPAIARLFSTEPQTIARTTPFVRAAGVSFVGLGLFRTYSGILKGAGDNRWTMYGRLTGLYVLLLPLTYLGTVTGLGIYAVYAAIVAETWSAAAITGYRVLSGKWTVVSRSYRPSPGAD